VSLTLVSSFFATQSSRPRSYRHSSHRSSARPTYRDKSNRRRDI